MREMFKRLIGVFGKASFTEKVIYLYIATLPFASGGGYLFFAKRVQYSELLFPILLFCWCLRKVRQKAVFNLSLKGSNGIFYCIWLFLAVTLFSSVNSSNLAHSIIEWLGLFYLALLFVILSDTIDQAEKFKRLLFVYASVSIIAALIGLGGFLHYLITRELRGNPLLFFYPAESSVLFFPRIKAFFYTPNMFAAFEHIGLAVLACIFFLSRRAGSPIIPRALFFITAGVIAVSIFLSASPVLAGVLVTLFMLLSLSHTRAISALRYLIFASAVIVTLFAFCATVWMIYPIKINNDRQARLVDIQVNYAYSHHIIPSMYAISMFKEHPLLGAGIGTFRDQYPKYINMDIERLSSIRMGVSADRILDPHNTYTGALAEWGLLGFLAMVLLFGGFFLLLIRRGRIPDSRSGAAGFALLAGFAGFLLNAFFIDIMTMRHLWVFLAIIFIFHRLGKEST